MVSILVRTLGRATLVRSVRSAIAQTHRPLEIVVVNAGAGELPPLPCAGEVDLRIVAGGPYSRPQAANAALAAARGEWLIFLDDDDAFEPTHVASLMDALACSPEARVAYSATACVGPDGDTGVLLNMDFDRVKLFERNYIQIGAGLFSASLVAEGARFDERLECFQDWDFWIQLAQRTQFAFTGRATNLWSAYAGESGAGMGANRRFEVTAPFHAILLLKWEKCAAALRRKVRHHYDAARTVAARGDDAAAQRHLAAAARLRSGPVPHARRAKPRRLSPP